jgi:hypothetical protein
VIVNNFIKKHPNLASEPKSSQNLININLINSILSYQKNNIQLSTKNNSLTLVATYENPDIQKDQIYLENKGKSGIYR